MNTKRVLALLDSNDFLKALNLLSKFVKKIDNQKVNKNFGMLIELSERLNKIEDKNSDEYNKILEELKDMIYFFCEFTDAHINQNNLSKRLDDLKNIEKELEDSKKNKLGFNTPTIMLGVMFLFIFTNLYQYTSFDKFQESIRTFKIETILIIINFLMLIYVVFSYLRRFLMDQDWNKRFSSIYQNDRQRFVDRIILSEKEKFNKPTRFIFIEEDLKDIKSRLVTEISSLNNKSIINLLVGIITSMLGILIVLFLFSFDKFDTITPFILNFIPKITIMVFMQTFSFYFLKIYKNNLQEIQYYQNELTNIEFKTLALKTALLSDDEKNIGSILNELLKTERNQVFKAGETTMDMEKYKSENEFHKHLIDKFFNILHIEKGSIEKREDKEKTDK